MRETMSCAQSSGRNSSVVATRAAHARVTTSTTRRAPAESACLLITLSLKRSSSLLLTLFTRLFTLSG